MIVTDAAFPDRLHVWVVRPRLRSAAGRCLVLCGPEAAGRFKERISHSVAVARSGVYHRVPYAGFREQLYLDARDAPAVPLLLVAADPLYWGGAGGYFAPHALAHPPNSVRVAFVADWPTSSAVVRVERVLRAPRYVPAWGPPPRQLERAALNLQKKLRSPEWPPPGTNDAMLRERAEELHRYYLAHGHCHVRERDPAFPELGKFLDNLRLFAKHDPWRLKRFQKLCRNLEPKLTVRDTRTRLTHVPDPHEAAAHTAKSGVFHERWLADYAALVTFHAEHGHSSVKTKGWPAGHPLARLGRWVRWQRMRMRDGSILPEQVELLRKLNFDFEPRQRRAAG